MMSKILVTGDTHGTIDFDKLVDFRRKFKNAFNKSDILIIAGDFGFIWSNEPDGEEKWYLKWLDEVAPWTTVFIDGNHENHPRLNAYPITEFCGAKAHQISDSVYHILRGEILKIDELKILCIGGADSHDKEWRTENVSWWPQETILPSDIENANRNLAAVGNSVDYIISHSLPNTVVKQVFHTFEATPSGELLEDLFYNTDFKMWITGHYHHDLNLILYNENVRFIYDDIIEIYDDCTEIKFVGCGG